MPTTKLPSNAKGWAVAMVSSMIGFFVGTYAMKVLGEMFA